LRSLLEACFLGLIACLAFGAPALAADPALADPAVDVQVLNSQLAEPSLDIITNGSLDSRFQTFNYRATRKLGAPFWLRLRPNVDFNPTGGTALVVEKGRHLHVDIFVPRDNKAFVLPKAAELSGYAGTQDAVFVVPDGFKADQSLYARVDPIGSGAEVLHFEPAVLGEILATGAAHERVIALTFGALMAMSLASLLMWFLLSDRLFLLYGTLFALNGLYVTYLSGEGFDWPILRHALPFTSDAWNVPAALAGATASLFIREIADLKRFSPRVYQAFGWLAGLFGVLAFSNVLKDYGFAGAVTNLGNLIFIGSAIFTLLVAARSWARGNRAAGWFLIAWGLLEGFTIATAARLLFADTDHLLYYGLPMSMVAAAILVALGVADRLREQRAALTEAERRAQTDPLTGVLNRRSLIERLEAACKRARARGLPIALLFIDLDHFKEINDTFGHLAGDACLAAVIDPIQAELRQSDVIGRYGGEEFVVILSSADTAAAYPIAQRILERVANVTVNGYGKPIRVTCSIGVAASDTLGVWDEHLIARADQAVYAAKRSGRNRVQIAEQLAA
jgi:diguanylate cyclase (GGDEF)-like protein